MSTNTAKMVSSAENVVTSNYKDLYEECRNQLLKEENKQNLLDTAYKDLGTKYHKLEEEYESMSSSWAKAIGEREKLTRSQQKTTEDYDENISNLIPKHETKIREIEDTIRAKDTIISSLKEKKLQLKRCLKGDRMFRINPKKTSNKNIDLN